MFQLARHLRAVRDENAGRAGTTTPHHIGRSDISFAWKVLLVLTRPCLTRGTSEFVEPNATLDEQHGVGAIPHVIEKHPSFRSCEGERDT